MTNNKHAKVVNIINISSEMFLLFLMSLLAKANVNVSWKTRHQNWSANPLVPFGWRWTSRSCSSCCWPRLFTELPQSVSCVTSLLELMGCFSAFSQFYDLRQKNVFQFIEEICFRSLASKENLVKYYKMCSQLVWYYYILQYF